MPHLLILLYCFLQTSIYSLQFNSSQGMPVQLGAYQGKKILFVNIATGSDKVNQLGELEQLRQQHADDLVILAFPSNSFQHEPRNNAAIRKFCEQHYNTGFVIASKKDVRGAAMQPVFKWLTRQSENGMFNTEVLGDFHKFLVNEEGQLIGEFAPSVSPLSPDIKNAITH